MKEMFPLDPRYILLGIIPSHLICPCGHSGSVIVRNFGTKPLLWNRKIDMIYYLVMFKGILVISQEIRRSFISDQTNLKFVTYSPASSFFIPFNCAFNICPNNRNFGFSSVLTDNIPRTIGVCWIILWPVRWLNFPRRTKEIPSTILPNHT